MEERDEQERLGEVSADENKARLVGEIVAEFVASLGASRAMTSETVVNFGESVSGQRSPLRRSDQRARVGDGHEGEPLNSASVCEQMARPQRTHFAAVRKSTVR